MKTKDQDIISNKLDQLDTLGGGIVFGREEAWEKLQGRMDKKPARKIGRYYGVAAAMLLLIACVFFLLKAPEQQLAAHTPARPANSSANATQSIVRQSAATDVETAPTTHKTVAKVAARNNTPVIEQPEVIKCPPADPAPIKPEAPAPATAVKATPQPMRIVHINELDNDGPPVMNTAPATAAVAPKQMKVVTLVEVMREEPPVSDPGKTSMPLVRVLFRQEQFTARSNTSAQSPFNIRINLQN